MVTRIFPLKGNGRKVVPYISGSFIIGSQKFIFNGRTGQHGIGTMHSADIPKMIRIIANTIDANEVWSDDSESIIIQFSIYPPEQQAPELNEGVGFEFNDISAFRYFCSAWKEDL